MGLTDYVNSNISKETIECLSDLQTSCNLLCFKAEQREEGKNKWGKASASCLHLPGSDHQIGNDYNNPGSCKKCEKASYKTSSVPVRNSTHVSELTVNLSYILVGTLFLTCLFSHLNPLKEVKHWKTFPREVVSPLSWKDLKTWLNKAASSSVQCCRSSCFEQDIKLESSWDPFQTEVSCEPLPS